MNHFKEENIQNQKGQLTIFLGVVLMVVVTALAFVINVGLFVKAKINLQNAVDAGAWAGASVQARQLTNIAYLNWEMRNTYKEYMFKYYILGQLGIQDQLRSPTTPRMSFRLKQFFGPSSTLGVSDFDPHNIPSTCIHFGSENNICAIYDVPGIPRFNTVGLPSITPMQESFLNTITRVKANNCSRRSDINFGVAMVWAYGTGSNLFQDAPQIAANRVGAWPQAFELAIRTRNVEYLLNQPPLTGGICNTSGSCDSTVSALNDVHQNNINSDGSTFPVHERSIKAFISAYNNLGGGQFKQSPENQNAFSSNFVLYELPPNELDIGPDTLSGYLINPAYIGGRILKYYVDLKLWPINFATFYTTFTSTQSIVAGVQGEATCKGSKTALPLPAYPFGFTKNPEVVTYYAVKGETKFIGMFYPFEDTSGITISAYSAAKPFGGRIGPVLFSSSDNQSIKARSATTNKSAAYFSTVEINDPSGTGYRAGFILPFNTNFWVQSQADTVGGTPATTGTDAKFVVPNLLYDTSNLTQMGSASTSVGGGTIQLLTDASTNNSLFTSPSEDVGLYDTGQFASLLSNLTAASATVMSNIEIRQSLASVRAPTRYEVANYMIPTLSDFDAGTEYLTPHTVRTTAPDPNIPSVSGGNIRRYRIFAPILGPGTLYQFPADLSASVAGFLAANENSVTTYLESLADVANKMLADAAANTRGKASSYADAAATIHDNPTDAQNPSLADCSKISMAGKFELFFDATKTETCDIKPLKNLIQEYIETQVSTPNIAFSTFYQAEYENHRINNNNDLMTAFYPGELGSVSSGGEAENTLSNTLATGISGPPNTFRNFYSTKFVGIQSLTTQGPGYFTSVAGGVILSEGQQFSTNEADVTPGGSSAFAPGRNFLDTSLIEEFKRGSEFDF